MAVPHEHHRGRVPHGDGARVELLVAGGQARPGGRAHGRGSSPGGLVGGRDSVASVSMIVAIG